MKLILKLLFISCLILNYAYAELEIPMFNTDSVKSVGVVIATDTKYGLLLTPDLFDLPPGNHGFHVHINASCADHGMAAGGHLDPANTGKHLGPYNTNGHLGDLPVLIVNQDGKATLPILAPRLTVKLIENHSLMIHAGGDNYSDIPAPNGGGGARFACGVIPKS